MITPQLSFMYTLIILGVIVGYMIVNDKNVAEYIWLQLQVIRINIIRTWMLFKIGTELKFRRWQMDRWMKNEMPRILKEKQEQEALNNE